MTEQIETTEASEEDIVTVAKVRDSLQTQMRRLKALARGDDIDARSVMHELHGTVMLLLGDIVDLIDRLEEHAEWASNEIDALQGASPTASQLNEEDADRICAFLDRVAAIGEQDDRWTDIREEALSLRGLIDDIRLTDDDEATTEDGEGDDAGDDDEAAPTNGATD